MKKYDFPKNSFGDKFNEIYFESLENLKNSDEYKKNLEKMDLYKKILKNNYKVNLDTINEFIEIIQEKIELEYENAIKDIINYIDSKNNSGLFLI